MDHESSGTSLENGSPVPKVHFEFSNNRNVLNSTLLKNDRAKDNTEKATGFFSTRPKTTAGKKLLLEAEELEENSLNETNISYVNMSGINQNMDTSLPINDTCESEPDLFRNGLGHTNINHKAASVVDEYQRTCELLFEKLVDLIFKLIWDGVSGSNEEAWKVKLIQDIDF